MLKMPTNSLTSWSLFRRPLIATVVLSLFVLPGMAKSNEFPTPHLKDINPAGIEGSLLIVGGGEIPEVVIERLLELAGGEDARLVVIPTASERADAGKPESFIEIWQERGFPSVEILHTRDRKTANSDEFVAPLKSATAIWFVGGQQSKLADAYVGTKVEGELYAILKRNGVIGGTSAGAAIQSRLMIAFGNPDATIRPGLNLVPGAVIDQHFLARNRQPRLTKVIADHPGYFGLGIDESTAIVVRGRNIDVIGESSVTVCFSKSETRAAKEYEVSTGRRADLTALRQAAIARSSNTVPDVTAPRVENGSLLIVGGGKMTEEMWNGFVELAGGDEARIVVVPTASGNPPLKKRGDVKILKEAGAKEVSVLHTTDRLEADNDEFIKPLNEATGVWFSGGRQWRIVDAYAGTATERAFHEVLQRGGVIGGSSAGATIQGEYLCRGNPLGNQDIVSEGYEKGFGFLPGTAIDQHFAQRKRQGDMESLKKTFPQLLGIGIDESTAIIVKKTTASVIGENDVYFYRASPNNPEPTSPTKVSTGGSYDLKSFDLID